MYSVFCWGFDGALAAGTDTVGGLEITGASWAAHQVSNGKKGKTIKYNANRQMTIVSPLLNRRRVRKPAACMASVWHIASS
jgi:hypothetical protein